MEKKTNVYFILVSIFLVVMSFLIGVEQETKKVECPTTYHLKIEKLTIHKVK